MDAERWAHVKSIFFAAAGRPADQRSAFIRSECRGDESLAVEIESLLAAHEQAGSFIEGFPSDGTTVAFQDLPIEPMLGKQIGPYKVIKMIGRGGMGEVYLAEDTRLHRKVAVKFLPSEIAADERARKRLLREAQAAAKLDHPNICAIHEVAEENGRSFIVMQYIEGESLASRLQHNPLELKEALDVAVQLADAVAEAHSQGVLHRDIKPQNIMINSRRLVKVMDFGLAKIVPQQHTADTEAQTQTLLSEPGLILGTVPYMSPEQVGGEPVDARSDIFSLGCVLYEMVSGHKPFCGESTAATISAILTREPAPIARYSHEVPGELERIVSKALRKDREERYQVIKDMALDLRSLKEELEFEAKLERSLAPDSGRSGSVTAGRGQAQRGSSPKPAAETTEVSATRAATSRYVVSKISQHKRAAVTALAAVVIAAVTVFFYASRPPAFTEKDTILLTDFFNTTEDEIFDGALKQALAIQLEQSPFLNIFPEQRVREALRYMGRSPDERVTKDVAREICQRQGIKATLVGTISSLGSHYVIGLEGVNAQTGDVIVREQAEADSKEQVLRALGGAATKLREKLGESLASIQKFDAPVEQATTSSLEALKAFSRGNEMLLAGKPFEAIRFFKRAVELDSDFALAYLKLGIAHFNNSEDQLGAEYAEKAFELRERTSEREKFYISFAAFKDEIDKSIEVLELWKQTYPRDIFARTNLSLEYGNTGQYEKAVEEAGEAVRLDPNVATPYHNLGTSFLCLNRFDEARAIFEQAVEKKLDPGFLHLSFYSLAFVQGDEATMQRQVDWAKGKPSEGFLLYGQAHAAAFSGQRRKSQDLFRRSAEANDRYGLKEAAAWGQADYALLNAAFGDCQQTKGGAVNALNIARSRQALMLSGVALALCGDTSQAQSLAGELAKRYPKDTFVNTTWLPTIQAALEINRGNTEQAIQLLRVARRFEMGYEVQARPAYVRGLAYLRGRAGSEAMAEFQKIIDHRGVVAVSALYPLAHLGLARAAAIVGNTAKSRKAYEDFFALWKDADTDIPILQQAKQEYEKFR